MTIQCVESFLWPFLSGIGFTFSVSLVVALIIADRINNGRMR